jgi:hypothetical protein
MSYEQCNGQKKHHCENLVEAESMYYTDLSSMYIRSIEHHTDDMKYKTTCVA